MIALPVYSSLSRNRGVWENSILNLDVSTNTTWQSPVHCIEPSSLCFRDSFTFHRMTKNFVSDCLAVEIYVCIVYEH